MQILDTPSLLAEGSASVKKKNIFKQAQPQADTAASDCCWLLHHSQQNFNVYSSLVLVPREVVAAGSGFRVQICNAHAFLSHKSICWQLGLFAKCVECGLHPSSSCSLCKYIFCMYQISISLYYSLSIFLTSQSHTSIWICLYSSFLFQYLCCL